MGIREDILNAKTALGIEFGSTRIKAVLVDSTNAPIASGSHEWENRLDNGIWTYTLEDIWGGLQDAYADMAADVKKQYDERHQPGSMLLHQLPDSAEVSRMPLPPEASALVFLPSCSLHR